MRQALRGVQQGMRVAPGLIADGRDMGTEVFRDAELKIFLDASVEERARRRHKQLMEKGSGVSLRDLFASIQARDESDRNRAVSPLRRAPDAISIDTTKMSVEAVVAEVLKHVEARGLTAGTARGGRGRRRGRRLTGCATPVARFIHQDFPPPTSGSPGRGERRRKHE